MSQRQIMTNHFVCLENFCENLCLPNGILSLQQVAKNQIRLNLYYLSWWQNSVAATKIFTKILQYTRSDLSLRPVASLCCCNLSSSVYQPLNKNQRMAFFVPQDEKKSGCCREVAVGRGSTVCLTLSICMDIKFWTNRPWDILLLICLRHRHSKPSV